MTPAEHFQLHGMVTDPEEAASILEKAFADIAGLFRPTTYRVVWESCPRNIHPAMAASWLRSKGWKAEAAKDSRGDSTVLLPTILVGETYQDLFSETFSAPKENQ